MEVSQPHPMAGATYARVYECRKCGVDFAYKKRFRNHLEEFHAHRKILIKPKKHRPKKVITAISHTDPSISKDLMTNECVICHKKFGNNKELSRHLASHTTDKPYECIECGKRFSKKDYLIKHIGYHSREMPYKCHLCTYEINRPDRYKIHMGQVHDIESPFMCTLCGEGFGYLKDLNKHLNSHNSSALDPGANASIFQRKGLCLFNCNDCGLTFENAQKYKYHMLKLHDVDEPFECSLCGTTFSNKLHLNRHLAEHNSNNLPVLGSTDSVDDITTSALKSKEVSNGHRRPSSSQEYEEFDNTLNGDELNMDSGTDESTELNSSMTTFSLAKIAVKAEGKKPSNVMASSDSKSSLYKKVGSKKKKFVCKRCGMHLCKKLDYIHHVKAHQKKLFECDVCGKAYTRNSNLKKHPCKGYRDEPKEESNGQRKLSGSVENKEFNNTLNGDELDSDSDVGVSTELNSSMPALSLTKIGIATKGKNPLNVTVASDNRASLNKELESLKNKSFVCKKCGLRLSKRVDYIHHVKSHKKKLFGCVVCGKSYTRNSNLKKHSCRGFHDDANSEKQKFNCMTCQLSFPSPEDLDEHILTHVTGLQESPLPSERLAPSAVDEDYGNAFKNKLIKSEPNDSQQCGQKHKKIKNSTCVNKSLSLLDTHNNASHKVKKDHAKTSFMAKIEVDGYDILRLQKEKRKSLEMEDDTLGESRLLKKKPKSKDKDAKAGSRLLDINNHNENVAKKESKVVTSSEIQEMIEKELSKYETNLSIPTVHKREHDESVLEYEKLVVFEYMSTVLDLPDIKSTSVEDSEVEG
ncbi:hypothetical protein SK128_010456, partial [Halocaridina rubra]